MNIAKHTAFALSFLTASFTFSNHALTTKKELIEHLYDIDAIRFGDFVLKVTDGYINTPIYIDMRRVMSHPPIMKKIVNCICDKAEKLSYDVVCGVPSAAVPYAAHVSLKTNKPMIMTRQKTKQYGLEKSIEGVYEQGNSVLLIEDVVVSGASALADIETIKSENLTINDIIVLCDREQGAIANLKNAGITPHALFTLSDILSILHAQGKLSAEKCEEIRTYIQNNQCS